MASALALEHNGDLYSCDHFVDPEHLLGNIMTTHMVELVAAPAQRAFGTAKRDTLPTQCRECPVLFACRGECPKNRVARTAAGEDGLNHLCAGYLHFFTHVDGLMRVMADALRRGGHAGEVMDVLPRAGRNEPCPCGSGRKTKQCHGAPLSRRTESRFRHELLTPATNSGHPWATSVPQSGSRPEGSSPMARLIAHWLRGLSGGGAVDNVTEVLATRARLDAELASLEAAARAGGRRRPDPLAVDDAIAA